MNPRHRRPRRAARVLAAVATVLALAGGALVVLAVTDEPGEPGEPIAGVQFLPDRADRTPAGDVSWWAPVHGEPLGVAVDGPDVAAAALDEVRLIDRGGGRTRWKTTVRGVRRYRPALAGDRVAATGETALVLLERGDGRAVAAVPFAGPGPVTLLDGPGGRRLAVAGSEYGQLLVVDAADGAVLWTVTHPGEIPVAARGDGTTVVAGWHDDAGATLRAFDLATGAPRWERPLGPVAGSPLVAGSTVVVVHGEGIHSAAARGIDLATGAERWQTPLPGWWDGALEPAGDRTDPATVYLLDGMGSVVALDPGTGAIRWRQDTGRPLVDGRLTLTPDRVLFASYDDELMVVDRADGRLRSAEVQSGVPIDVAGAGDRVVVALRLATPSRVEARPVP
jgi:outer membrane protein assembly factor BamB